MRSATRRGHRDGGDTERVVPRDPAPPGEHRLGRVEDDAQPAPAGVDHAGLAQLPELLGGVQERLSRGRGGGREDVASPRPRLGGTPYGGVGGGAGDGQDRALDRRTDSGVAGLGGLGHGLCHHGGVVLLGGGAGDPECDGAQDLAEDDAAVAAGAEQCPSAERGQRGSQVELLGRGLVDRVAGSAHREVHVGAGVAVGHRVDVEGVDLLARVGEGVDGDVHEAPYDGELDAAAGRCFHGLPCAVVGCRRLVRSAGVPG